MSANSTIPPIPPGIPSDLLLTFSNFRVYQYLQVAPVMMMLYDYLLTVGDEVEFVWQRRLTLSSALFYFTRYIVFADSIALLLQTFLATPKVSTCVTIYHTKSWMYMVSFLVADSILVLRTYAIWDNDRRIGYSLFGLLFAVLSASGYCVNKFINSLVNVPSPSPKVFPGCFIAKASRILWVSYLLIASYESVIFGITLFRVLYQKRWGKSPLFQAIYHDGVLVYFWLLIASIINVIVVNTARPELSPSLSGFHRVLHAIFSCRLILNMRRAALHRPFASATLDSFRAAEFPSDSLELGTFGERTNGTLDERSQKQIQTQLTDKTSPQKSQRRRSRSISPSSETRSRRSRRSHSQETIRSNTQKSNPNDPLSHSHSQSNHPQERPSIDATSAGSHTHTNRSFMEYH